MTLSTPTGRHIRDDLSNAACAVAFEVSVMQTETKSTFIRPVGAVYDRALLL
jgi:hypothetical protein